MRPAPYSAGESLALLSLAGSMEGSDKVRNTRYLVYCHYVGHIYF